MATVETSIGAGTTHDQSVDITGVSGSGPTYTVTLAAAGTDVVNGDALWDEHATPRKYLITAGAGTTSLTVKDSTGVGGAPDQSATSTAQVTRYYNGTTPLTNWEAGLEDNTNLYATSDDVIGTCYNDAAFNEGAVVTINWTPTYNSVRLTVAPGHRHYGYAGKGVRLIKTASHDTFTISKAMKIEWLEIDNSGFFGWAVNATNGSTGTTQVENMLIHNAGGNATDKHAIMSFSEDRLIVKNCVVYDWANTATVAAFYINVSGVTGACFNCTAWNVTSGTGTGYGFRLITNSANCRVINCIAMDCEVDFSFPGTTVDSDYNISSDATADDGGGSNNQISVASADVFVQTSTDRFFLKDGSPALGAGIGNGSDSSVPLIDIAGWERPSTSPDIGAYQQSNVTVSVGQGTTHDQNVDITNATGSGPQYTVTLAAAGTNVANGDALWDEAASPRKYLILSGAGTTTLTVRDSEGVGSAPDFSATSTAQVKRYYNGTTPLHDFNDGLVSVGSRYVQGSNIVAELYNDAAFDIATTVLIDHTNVFSMQTLRPATGHGFRDLGIGSGVRLVKSASAGALAIRNAPFTVDQLQFQANGFGTYMINVNGTYTVTQFVYITNNVISGNMGNDTSPYGIYLSNSPAGYVANNLIYGFIHTDGTLTAGIYCDSSRTCRIYHNTVVDVTGSSTTYGIRIGQNVSNQYCKNNIAMNSSSTDLSIISSGTNVDDEYNLTSDSTADNYGDVTHSIVDAVDTDIFTNPATDDYTLKTGSAAIGAGLGYSSESTLPTTDIMGNARSSTAPSMGAFEGTVVPPSGIVRLLDSFLVGSGRLVG